MIGRYPSRLEAGPPLLGSAPCGALCWTARREPGDDHRSAPRRHRRDDLAGGVHDLRRAAGAGEPAAGRSAEPGTRSWRPCGDHRRQQLVLRRLLPGGAGCGRGGRSGQPDEPRPRGRAGAGRDRRPGRDRGTHGPAPRWPALDRSALPALESVVLSSDGADVPGGVPLDDLLAAEPAPLLDRAADDLAVLIFTSGTAGSPKAAMLTHGNLLTNLEQCQAHPGRSQGTDDVVFGVLPLFHIFGLNVVLGLSLHGRRHGAAGRALRSAIRHRVDREPRRHRRERCAHDVGGVGRPARGPARAISPRCDSPPPGPPSSIPQVQRDDRGSLRGGHRRGLRPHRGLAGGHLRDRAGGSGGQHRGARCPACTSASWTPTATTRSWAMPVSCG